MKTHKGRLFFWMASCGMIWFIASCNNDFVSEKQAESFMKYYAVDNDKNSGTRVIQTSDEGFAILSNLETQGEKDMFLIMTDEFGRQKTGLVIGTSGRDHGYGMIRTTNGYLICGSSTFGTQKQGYLVNVSSDGREIVWEENYGWFQELEFRDIQPGTDGNLIMTGYLRKDQADKDFVIFKTSEQGDSLWYRSYLYPDNDIGEAIIEYQNRYLILITSTNVNSPNESHIRVVSTNIYGRGITHLDLQEKQNLTGKDIAVNSAGNLYILGNLEDNASRESKIFLAEILPEEPPVLGDTASISDPESSLHAESFSLIGDEGLAIGGWRSKPLLDEDILFMTVGNDFKPLASKAFGTRTYQAAQHIIYTPRNGGYALTGSVDLGGAGRTTMLLKLDSEGELK